MMRSLWLVPSSRSSSKICTSTGALTEIHPDNGAFFGVVSGTISEAVVPGSILTSCVIDPRSFSEQDRGRPGREPLDGQRRLAVRVTIDRHFGPGRLGPDAKLAEHRGHPRQRGEMGH